MASLRSPKSPFRVEINFLKPVKELGSVVSFTGEDPGFLGALVEKQVRDAKVGAIVKLYKNMATYPEFNWVQLDRHVVNERGEVVNG